MDKMICNFDEEIESIDCWATVRFATHVEKQSSKIKLSA